MACNPDQPAQSAELLADSGPDIQPQALTFSRLALINDPASPFRWADLADLYLALRPPGDPQLSAAYLQEARACFRRAEQLSPSNPVLFQRIANFHFQLGETAEAIKRTYRVLQVTREFDRIIFASYVRFGIPQSQILADGVPAETAPARSFLSFSESQPDIDLTKAVWNWASAIRPTPLDDGLAERYAQILWQQGEFVFATQALAGYLGVRTGDYLHPNRIFNGGFESQPSPDNPVDWSTVPTAGVTVDRDTESPQQGAASMRLQFDGTRNLDYHGFGQTQPIAPGQYRFRAMVKTKGISTDQGVRLRVYDPEAPTRLDLDSPAETGSSDWHPVELRFSVRTPTRLLRVEVVRQPSIKFDSKIAGTVWLDSISLIPQQ